MKRIALRFAALLAFAGLAFGQININNATKEQLEVLNGIGPVKAQAIVDYRTKNGPFKRLEEVKNVDGVGDATFEKIRGDIKLTGATDTKPAEARQEKAKAAEAPSAKAESKADADAKKAKAKADAEAKKAKADAEKEAKKAKSDADAKKDADKKDAKKDEEKKK